ncbi:MAG: 16S rRNA (cytidine(1402)-2'-O)-methyltransferase [Desulfatiglandales bacterium]
MVSNRGKNGLGQGKIYVVSTPIGNLEDITLRALRVLKEVGLIAAESREHTMKLCKHYNIGTPITSYNSHNQHFKGRVLLKRVKSGLDIALVSDAGTPGLSDPGSRLIREAINANITLVPVPGVSASLTALSVSGLPSDRFIFVGFFSNKKGRRRKELEGLKFERRTMIFFESPHRLIKMLTDIYEILGDRYIVLAKEMTKVFEGLERGSVSKVLSLLKDDKIKGEYTIIVEGLNERDRRLCVIDN